MSNKFVLVLSMLVSTYISAESDHHEHHEAHTHGEADMVVVFDAGKLVVEMESPAENLLGFEHEPKAQEQKTRVKTVYEVLQKPEALFDISAACDLTKNQVEVPFFGQVDAHNDHDHAHHDHDHEKHVDVHVHYVWQCEQAPQSIEIKLFQAFSGFEKISVQWIVKNKQGLSILKKGEKAVLEF